ncbi:MAG: sugar transferase [Anaerolineaceae bacterium]|nr:sugar transferase [Anaerolineaceae bacterium]
METITQPNRAVLLPQGTQAGHRLHVYDALRAALKRAADLLISFFGLMFLSPVFLVIAAAIRRDSPGPVFYRGPRLGRAGREFKILKFRTMYETPASYDGLSLTAGDDTRITPLGRWLRDTKINELPQLWNVLLGQMSFVGPRPEDPAIAAGWPEDVRREVLSVRPGITSPSSVIYRNEEKLLSGSSVMDDYLQRILPEKLRLDQLYVRHPGLLADLDVFFMTLISLLPKLRTEDLPERLLFSGPFYNFVRRYLSWFAIDTLIAFTGITFATLMVRLYAPLNIGWGRCALMALAIALLLSVTNTFFGLKRITWRYASPAYVFDLGLSTFLTIGLLTIADVYLIPHRPIPLRILPDGAALVFVGFVIVRYRERILTGFASRWLDLRRSRTGLGERVLIVGAGECGELATWLLHKSRLSGAFTIAGFVDDDYHKQDCHINGYPILGGSRDIPTLVAKHNIGLILFAISTCSGADRERILAACRATPARLVLIPDLLGVLEQAIIPTPRIA